MTNLDFVKKLNDQNLTNLGKTLDMEFVAASSEEVVIRMPVTEKVHQPFGLLHGGASVALAESAASVGAILNLDLSKQRAVGLEINANHLRGVKSGFVIATAKPLHRGKTTHVWEIQIKDEQDQLVCISRCTLAIINQ